jgi:hypothetical protein
MFFGGFAEYTIKPAHAQTNERTAIVLAGPTALLNPAPPLIIPVAVTPLAATTPPSRPPLLSSARPALVASRFTGCFEIFIPVHRCAPVLTFLLTVSPEIADQYDGSDPNGIRTRVTAVKGRCPRPLDDRVGERQISGRGQTLQAAFRTNGSLSLHLLLRYGTQIRPFRRSVAAAGRNLFNQYRCSCSRFPMRLKDAKRVGHELFSCGCVAQQTP